MTQINCHIPIKLRISGELTDRDLDRLGEALTRALIARIAFAERTMASRHEGLLLVDQTDVREPFAANRIESNDRYTIPSFDGGGQPTKLPVKKGAAAPAPPPNAPWTVERVKQHIRQTFGTYGPVGNTHYGVQTPAGIVVVWDVVGGEPDLRLYAFNSIAKDVRGHWEQTGTERRYGRGRYVYEVTERNQDENPYRANVGRVRDLEGNDIIKRVQTNESVGFRLVIDVPETPQATTGDGGRGGSTHGKGLIPGSGIVIYLECHPRWDPSPLSDPAFAGTSDDDLFRLFLNLCNARAIQNLDLSEKYIREQVAPLYTGPNGAPNVLSDYSRHNIQHFQEDLRLLRGLMYVQYRLWEEIRRLQTELDSLIMVPHRSSGSSLFGPVVVETYWPTIGAPNYRDRRRAEELLTQLSEKGQAVRTVMSGILTLVRQNPILTQFVSGLSLEGGIADVPSLSAIEAPLADVSSPEQVQEQILKRLNDILSRIAKARQKLCVDPERVLDVPLVYQKVQEDLKGINPRFDQVAEERIKRHQRQKMWTDIALGALGLALFVGGLIVSLAGGPAGVVAFLELSGTALGVIQAYRSVENADFLTNLAEAAVQRGSGLVTLEAAKRARFWATVDVALAAFDVGLQSLRAARAVAAGRQAEEAARAARAAEEFGQSVESGRRLPFDDLIKRAAPRGQLPLSAQELSQLEAAVGRGGQANQIVGRIAEEAAERTVTQTGEYVRLASRLRSNQGIDSLFVRRRIFEEVFGRLANPNDAAGILARASEAQRQQLLQALRRSRNAEDLVSLEVKFSQTATSVEELLSASRAVAARVQQNAQWYQRVIPEMLRSADNEVRATGRLLDQVVGVNAQNLERLTRIGISMDVRGTFTLTRLTDQIINVANQSKRLYRSRRYYGLAAALVEAERAGNTARATQLRTLLQNMNRQIDALDTAVRQAKQTETAARRAQASLQRASDAVAQVDALRTAQPTPATLEALAVANGVARAHLQAVKYATDEAEPAAQRVNQAIADAQKKLPEYEAAIDAALDEWDRQEPGAKERFLRLGDAAPKQEIETTSPSPQVSE